ncbi:bifunctional enoyl-CoA hydratase/phosphate acetyltransferase [Desulfitobacterium chlororespirans]|uniref:Phosphate butyryltransferase n=1 Tax=Desulfitobacterium chlororespirans DSM 11544 TaxID=1121395 RepID=A0A1M7S425_9FIRM|nr:bifunctional enoyl-CoA hydratase/phosphate acetyltransferase [Desulfitobacterium chlororespirans]SHN53206.1 phosphate butyryltransferase [Desulfitobacterium chlororespirans DSM 11544]
MAIKNFAELIAKVQTTQDRKRMAVVAADDEHTLEAVIQARRNAIAEPLLIGNPDRIREVLKGLQEDAGAFQVIEALDNEGAAYKGVELIHQGQADIIMKGKLQTGELLRAVVDKEKGLRAGKIVSHIAFKEIPNYHKLVVMTDGGMATYPDLEQKRHILENAVHILHVLGYAKPKAAVLAAVETLNPKMPETVDAAELKALNLSGELMDCIVEGPISYDLAMSKEAARLKGYQSPVAGDADILLMPNITAGNILGKCLLCSAQAKMAGFIVGARVPVVVTSRGSTAEEKYLSIVLAAAVA